MLCGLGWMLDGMIVSEGDAPMAEEKIRYPLKNKLIVLILVAMVPILYITIYLIMALLNYSRAYDRIVSSMTVANNYNMNFKEEMDESLYKLVVSNVTFDTIEEDGTLKDPYKLIEELRGGSNNLLAMTTDRDSRVWLQSLLRNVDTLEDRVEDIKANQEIPCRIINGGASFVTKLTGHAFRASSFCSMTFIPSISDSGEAAASTGEL